MTIMRDVAWGLGVKTRISLVLSAILYLMSVTVTADEKESDNVKEELSLGIASAPVTLIEYGSLTCDHCVRFHRKVFPIIDSKYIANGRVRFIFRDFPTSDTALRGAVAARCAGDQYYDMLNQLFHKTHIWTQAANLDAALVEQAVSLGLDKEAFTDCLSDPANEETVLEVQKTAKTEFDITGTPSFLINGKLVKGERNPREIKRLLDDALGQSGAASLRN